MSHKLNERDSLAVDAILMNGRNMNSSTVPPVAMSSGGVSPEAFRAASKVLQLLDALEEEPPKDLAERTIKKIAFGPNSDHPREDRPSRGDSHFA